MTEDDGAPPTEQEAGSRAWGERLGLWLKRALIGSLAIFGALLLLALAAIVPRLSAPQPAPNVLLAALGVAALLIPACAILLLFHVYFFRLQARLLELLVTVIAVSAPIGFAARQMTGDVAWNDALIILAGAVCGLMVFGGSLWGLSAARRLKESRAWPRLGLLVIGWCMVYALPTLMAAPFVTGEAYGRRRFDAVATAIIFWIIVLVGVVGVFIERRCRRVGGSENI